MSAAYDVTVAIHAICGFFGLAAFWFPAFAPKGSRSHMTVGRLFYAATALVALTGIVMGTLVLVDPLGARPPARAYPPETLAAIAEGMRLRVPFLFYLVLITFAPVYHGVRVLATRQSPEMLRTSFHTAINVAAIIASMGLVALAIALRQPVYAALSPIGFLVGYGNLRFARRPYDTPMAWWYEHMGAMIAGGIAFHTAFLVFGAGRVLGLHIDGPLAVLPWILPTVIGVPAGNTWVKYYKQRFGEDRSGKVARVRKPIDA